MTIKTRCRRGRGCAARRNVLQCRRAISIAFRPLYRSGDTERDGNLRQRSSSMLRDLTVARHRQQPWCL